MKKKKETTIANYQNSRSKRTKTTGLNKEWFKLWNILFSVFKEIHKVLIVKDKNIVLSIRLQKSFGKFKV